MQANGPCGQHRISAQLGQKLCEPEENPMNAQGHMGRLLNREPGEVRRKATKRKAPDYNRALPSSLTPSKSVQKTNSKKMEIQKWREYNARGRSVSILNVCVYASLSYHPLFASFCLSMTLFASL